MLNRDYPHRVSATYKCEICGTEVSDVDVVSYIGGLALPGKNGVIPAFGCPAEQHFGCSEEHAWQAFVACHDEHLKPAHAQKHFDVEADPEKSAAVQHLKNTHHQRKVWKEG